MSDFLGTLLRRSVAPLSEAVRPVPRSRFATDGRGRPPVETGIPADTPSSGAAASAGSPVAGSIAVSEWLVAGDGMAGVGGEPGALPESGARRRPDALPPPTGPRDGTGAPGPPSAPPDAPEPTVVPVPATRQATAAAVVPPLGPPVDGSALLSSEGAVAGPAPVPPTLLQRVVPLSAGSAPGSVRAPGAAPRQSPRPSPLEAPAQRPEANAGSPEGGSPPRPHLRASLAATRRDAAAGGPPDGGLERPQGPPASLAPRSRRRPDPTGEEQPSGEPRATAPGTAPPAPVIRVTIGRVEVRAARPSLAALPPAARPREPVLSLEDYLKERTEDRR